MVTKRELKNALLEELRRDFGSLSSEVYLDINKIEIDYSWIEDADEQPLIVVDINCGVENEKSDISHNYNFQIEYKDGSSLEYIRGCFHSMFMLKDADMIKEDED